MRGNQFGLDIGSSTIKIAKIKRSGQSLVLESIAQAVSVPDWLTNESGEGLVKVGDSIKQLIASTNIKGRDVNICLAESQVYTKIIEMPQLSTRELSAALRYEIEQYIPMPIDKVRTDWEVLGSDKGSADKKISVMLVAAPIATLEKYQQVMQNTGLNANTMETEIISAYRSLSPLFNSPYSNMIVHVGAMSTTMAIVREGVIRMIFSVNLGGNALTRSLALELGIDMQQAENYKNTYGLNKDAFEGKIGGILTTILDQIALEIKKGLLSFREKHNSETIKQVILSGGSALLPGIDAYLTNSLSTQVVIGSAFSAYGIQNVPPALEAQAPEYNVVVGLAIRNLL